MTERAWKTNIADPEFRAGLTKCVLEGAETDADMDVVLEKLALAKVKAPYGADIGEILDRFAEVPDLAAFEAGGVAIAQDGAIEDRRAARKRSVECQRRVEDLVVHGQRTAASATESYSPSGKLDDYQNMLADVHVMIVELLWTWDVQRRTIEQIFSENKDQFSDDVKKMKVGELLASADDQDYRAFKRYFGNYVWRTAENTAHKVYGKDTKSTHFRHTPIDALPAESDNEYSRKLPAPGASLPVIDNHSWTTILQRVSRGDTTSDLMLSRHIFFASFMRRFADGYEVDLVRALRKVHLLLGTEYRDTDEVAWRIRRPESGKDSPQQVQKSERKDRPKNLVGRSRLPEFQRFYFLAWALASSDLRELIKNEDDEDLKNFRESVLFTEHGVGRPLNRSFKAFIGNPHQGKPGLLFQLLHEDFDGFVFDNVDEYRGKSKHNQPKKKKQK